MEALLQIDGGICFGYSHTKHSCAYGEPTVKNSWPAQQYGYDRRKGFFLISFRYRYFLFLNFPTIISVQSTFEFVNFPRISLFREWQLTSYPSAPRCLHRFSHIVSFTFIPRATTNKKLRETVALELSYVNSNLQLLKEELADLNSSVLIYQNDR